MEAANKPAFIAPSSPIATLPTGIPFGICTIDNKLSNPFNLRLSTGTPITGIVVNDAIIPGKCAEPPAPAIMTEKLLSSAALANLNILSGVPVESRKLKGLDSLLSIVQMPKGIPVGSVAIGEDGAMNAGLYAASIIALTNREIKKNLKNYRTKQSKSVKQKP